MIIIYRFVDRDCCRYYINTQCIVYIQALGLRNNVHRLYRLHAVVGTYVYVQSHRRRAVPGRNVGKRTETGRKENAGKVARRRTRATYLHGQSSLLPPPPWPLWSIETTRQKVIIPSSSGLRSNFGNHDEIFNTIMITIYYIDNNKTRIIYEFRRQEKRLGCQYICISICTYQCRIKSQCHPGANIFCHPPLLKK